MEGVCLCSLLCVTEFVHCLGVSNLLTFPCAFWGHIHSELSVAAPYDLLRAAEAADICACEDHVMRVNVGIKMNASDHEGMKRDYLQCDPTVTSVWQNIQVKVTKE